MIKIGDDIKFVKSSSISDDYFDITDIISLGSVGKVIDIISSSGYYFNDIYVVQFEGHPPLGFKQEELEVINE